MADVIAALGLMSGASPDGRRLRTATFIEALDRAKDEACNSRDCSGAGGFVLGLANESLVEDVAPIACV